ncbi:MAG: hypothetical protein JOY99_17095 [Sphingomonadaceae bacterium]|nr:hypothetical protein [Sphingomonadaceae bacterium]
MGMPAEKLPDWPAAMSRELALAYTGVGEAKMREWMRRGLVKFRACGPRGEMIAQRVDLDVALRDLFSSPTTGLEEDMDFGD